LSITIAAPTADAQHLTHPHPKAQVGLASWYGKDHQGMLTASGRRFDRRKLTAAHKTLPLNIKAKVTNLENGKTVEVTIDDRGPYISGRVIDLSERAARRLGMKKEGLAVVKIEPLPEKLALD
jgi:rare lipoprotein A